MTDWIIDIATSQATGNTALLILVLLGLSMRKEIHRHTQALIALCGDEPTARVKKRVMKILAGAGAGADDDD